MTTELIRTFTFDAAHRLVNAPEGHKCRRMHGHSYRVDIHVTGDVDPHAGWVMDFGQIKEAVEPIVAELDHSCLNDIPGLENSTSEMVAKFLFDRIKPALTELTAVTVWESAHARAVYRA